MTKERFEFHAPHQGALHHSSQDTPNGPTSTNQIAMFTAIVATVGALFSYMGGFTQANAVMYKKIMPPLKKLKLLTNGIITKPRMPSKISVN